MKRTLAIIGFVMTIMVMSCSGPSIEGTWIEPATKQTEEQGITLYKDGTATAVNMKFTNFTSWEKRGDLLILKGFNTGYANQEFSDTMKIEKITETELVLSQDNYSLTYKRK